MKASNKTMSFSDKTTNIYRLTREKYDKVLSNSITATYKKTNNNIKKKITATGKQVLRNNKVSKRMQANVGNNCFISLKDHKENFQNNPTARLINPAKKELAKINKIILDKLNKNIREMLQLNRWKNKSTVADWFIAIQDKQLQSFVIFDIKDFHPSIKVKLLTKVLKFAESYTDISDEDKSIINHSRKSFLFNDQQACAVKESGLFKVTMGAYEGAKVCELVGSYLPYQLSINIRKKTSAYIEMMARQFSKTKVVHKRIE